MSIPKSIDFDKIIFSALNDCNSTLNAWLKGRPRSEEAFLNRLTEKISRKRRNCDVGVNTPTYLHTLIYELHRKGENQKDLYGADLAVSVVFEDELKIKTAFFQLKRSSNYILKTDRSQFEDALSVDAIGERSFLLAIDEDRKGFRINTIKDMFKHFNNNSKSKTFDASNWYCLTEFLWKWFSCDIGKSTKFNEPYSVESLLQNFIVEPSEKLKWITERRIDDNPEKFIPAKSWVIFQFLPSKLID